MTGGEWSENADKPTKPKDLLYVLGLAARFIGFLVTNGLILEQSRPISGK